MVFIGILITLIIYGIIIKTVDSGRCFRYEYIVKTLIIFGLYIVCFCIIYIHFNLFSISFFVSFPIIGIPVLMFLNLKYTIQRLYDLGLSGWYILLKLIPIFSIFVTIYLYLKKGNCEINIYDKAINYKKLYKDRHFIDIYENMIAVDDEQYIFEQYFDKYTIKISEYSKQNIFADYLLENYQAEKIQIYKTIEIKKDDLVEIIEKLNLVVIINSFYIRIKQFELFIRKENFHYTIILNKHNNTISKELFDTFDFPGAFSEDETYIYYSRIYKDDLLTWIKNTS